VVEIEKKADKINNKGKNTKQKNKITKKIINSKIKANQIRKIFIITKILPRNPTKSNLTPFCKNKPENSLTTIKPTNNPPLHPNANIKPKPQLPISRAK
jgi:hypothetical protein